MKTKNLTVMPVGTKITSRRPPQPEMAVIVRGKFSIVHGGTLALVEDAPTLLSQGFMTADTFAEEDEERSGQVLYPSDFADYKPRADVMLKGTCHAPHGKPVTECPVKFSVGQWSKTLKIVGRRVFSDRFSGAEVSDPIPFTKLAVSWENAFGGAGVEKNPVGKGASGAELPNVEAPGLTMRSRSDRLEPAGFGPINPLWAPRAGRVGKNYGPQWKKERAPYFSDDFSFSHFQSAPEDQWLPYLKGDELLGFANLDPKHAILETQLPGLRVRAFVNDDKDRFREVKLELDTIFADLDEGLVYLTWRGLDAVREDDRADVKTVLIASEPLGDEPRKADHYKAELVAFEADPLGLASIKKPERPDTKGLEKKLEDFKALQASMKESANNDDPKGLEKAVTGALGLAGGSEAERLSAEVPALLGQAAANDPVGNANAGFAAVSKKQVKPPSLKLVKPGETPAIQMGEAGAELASIKTRLPEIEQQMRDANLPMEGFDKLKEMLADPRLAKLGETPASEETPRAGQDLSGMDLRGRDLRGLDLSACIMKRTLLSGANLAGARLVGANLSEALLDRVDLSAANLSNANLSKAILTGAIAPGAAFDGAEIRMSLFGGANLRSASFDNARVELSVFGDADLKDARFSSAKFLRTLWNAGKLDGTSFEGATLDSTMMRGCTATKASFAKARLLTAAFIETDLTGATFHDAKGERAIFTKSVLREVSFERADLFRSHFTEAKAERAKCGAADLKGSRFYRSVFIGATFEHANLLRADFSKADLTRVRFKGANLYEAAFIDAFGASTDFTDANLKRAILEIK